MEQVFGFALAAGFSPDQAATMCAVAKAESGLSSTAHAAVGEDSKGLWQINAAAHPDLDRKYDLYDPVQNAKAAYEVSHHGADVSPWTTVHHGSQAKYVRFRTEALAAAASHGYVDTGLGNWSGTEGYGHPMSAGAGGPSGVDSVETIGQEGAPTPGGVTVFVGEAPAATTETVSADGREAGVVEPIAVGGSHDWRKMRDTFVTAAVEQKGDAYVYGAHASLADPNPKVFDCSELTMWAAHRAGFALRDGAWAQFQQLRSLGGEISVEEASHTPGALVFYFDGPHTGTSGGPSEQHVAIVEKDGITIEAKGRRWGVGEFEVAHRFNYAAVIPDFVPPAGADPALRHEPVGVTGHDLTPQTAHDTQADGGVTVLTSPAAYVPGGLDTHSVEGGDAGGGDPSAPVPDPYPADLALASATTPVRGAILLHAEKVPLPGEVDDTVPAHASDPGDAVAGGSQVVPGEGHEMLYVEATSIDLGGASSGAHDADAFGAPVPADHAAAADHDAGHVGHA